MPAGRFKSGTFKKIQKKTPGGRLGVRYEKRKPSAAHCGNCGSKLSGVPREMVPDLRKMAKTEKRPERPYGGVLCSKCMRAKMVKKARG